MKLYQLLPIIFLTSCASTNYNPFLDEKISKNNMCQSDLKTLVENEVFIEVKTLVDRECNLIVFSGWVKGHLDGTTDRRCIASFKYLKERPALQKIAKKFLKNECYPENPNKYYWKSRAKNT